jgi:ubiquinone/menaquinone biosynthesis C-methylase UbiE
MSISFDRAAEYYDETRGFPPGEEKGAAEAFVRVGKFDGSQRVLEVGVGTGRIALPVAPQVAAYMGIDISTAMMGRLREKQQNERVLLTQGDATRLPFPTASFDAAIAVHVFHLIPGWQNALQEVKRVLRPGAPLLHGFNADARPLDMHEVLSAKFGTRAAGTRSKAFLEDAGWQMVEEEIHRYTLSRRPLGMVETFRRRLFSATWDLSDEDMETRAQYLEQVIRERFPDPNQPVEVEARFHVKVYLPPH